MFQRSLRLLLFTALTLGLISACGSDGASTATSERDLARAMALHAEALKASEAGNNPEAMGLLEDAFALDPESEPVHVARSAFGERAGVFDAAIDSTEWLLQRNPKDADMLARLVRCGLNSGRVDVARKALTRLSRVDPKSARTASLSARFYLEIGDLGSAEKHASRSAELIPEQTEAHYIIGLASEYSNESELAIESFRRVIFVDPGHLGARDHLAILLLRLGRRKESGKHREIHSALLRAMPAAFRHFPPAKRVDDFEEIIAMLPEWDFGYLELARALMQLDRLSEARKSLEIGLSIRPRAAESNELMASILRRMGDEEGAARHATLAGNPATENR